MRLEKLHIENLPMSEQVIVNELTTIIKSSTTLKELSIVEASIGDKAKNMADFVETFVQAASDKNLEVFKWVMSDQNF